MRKSNERELTPHERRLIPEIAQGKPYREIARERQRSHQTIRNEAYTILEKTGASNRIELSYWWQTGKFGDICETP